MRLLAFALVLVACLGCDQASKRIAETVLERSGDVTLLGDTVRFQLVTNPGAFLSLGSELPVAVRTLLLSWLVPLLIASLCFYFLRSVATTRLHIVAIGLVAGGGMGNWVDRMLNDGAVIDFVSIGVGPLRTGIFNLADVAVMVGAGILLFFAGSGPKASESERSREPEPE